MLKVLTLTSTLVCFLLAAQSTVAAEEYVYVETVRPVIPELPENSTGPRSETGMPNETLRRPVYRVAKPSLPRYSESSPRNTVHRPHSAHVGPGRPAPTNTAASGWDAAGPRSNRDLDSNWNSASNCRHLPVHIKIMPRDEDAQNSPIEAFDLMLKIVLIAALGLVATGNLMCHQGEPRNVVKAL